MAIFEDKQLQLHGNTPDDTRDFQIAWLNRRVENLEAMVFALLRDRAHYEMVEGYRKTLENPGFAPSSAYIKGRGENLVALIHKNYSTDVLGWPELED